jgi:uncharacterized protein (TIGR02246 family)
MPQPTAETFMKKLLSLPVLFALFVLPAASAGQKEDDAAIHQRSAEWDAAWNKHDAKLMAAFFVADGDLVNPFGRQAHGQAEVEKLFTEEQSGVMAGTTYTGTIENIRHLGKNIAIVDVAAEISGMKGPDGAVAPPFKHHVTWIAEKKDGKWMAVGARAFVTMTMPAPAK